VNSELEKLIDLVKKIPKNKISGTIEYIENILKENQDITPSSHCPHCGGETIVRNGHKSGKQSYLCRTCGKSFVETTNTALEFSHYGESVWEAAIRDTLEGISLDKTAKKLGMSHKSAFRLRHKILIGMEIAEELQPTVLTGVCELDDTYVLESMKGSKIPENYHRKARKHGAVAGKRGISSEYISICAGVKRGGGIYTKTVNRATPTSENINEVFAAHITQGSLVLCDGAKSFKSLSDKCDVSDVNNIDKADNKEHFYHINNVNGYHSFIKQRYEKYRGVATKYLNRYNVMFSKAFNCASSVVGEIFKTMTKIDNDSRLAVRVNDIQTENLLTI
jgi:transposase-like protein